MTILFFLSFLIVAGIPLSKAPSTANDVAPSLCNVTLVELRDYPERYIGLAVNVRAIYVAGLEMGFLKDPSGSQARSEKGFLYEFDSNYQQRSKSAVLKRMNKLLSKRILKPTDVNQILGAFTVVVTRYQKQNEFDRRADYVITIMKVISVKEVAD